MTEQAAARQKAQVLLDLRRYADARDVLLAAGVPDAGDADASFLLSWALVRTGDPRGALAAADAGLRRAPEREQGHRLRSLALSQAGDHHGAYAAAYEAARLAPHEGRARLALANAMLELGWIDHARAAGVETVRLDPEQVYGHRLLGRIEREAGQPERARQHYLDALAIDPEDSESVIGLGIAEHDLANLDAAAGHFAAAVRIDPSGPGAHNHQVVVRRTERDRWLRRRRWQRIASGALNPAMGLSSVSFWWRRRRQVAGSEDLYGPILWSGGLWRAAVRVGLTLVAWACLLLVVATGAWAWVVAVLTAFWLALHLGARVPVTEGFRRRTAARTGGDPPEERRRD